ncbi:MAG: hypothetical protein JWN48_1113 [Myxococcaceae bacterium]|nr:hypothetical protein [Myxococcaceae bacterium]
MNSDKLISIDDADLENVAGGDSVTVSFPGPDALIGGAVTAVKTTLGAIGTFIKGLGFGISYGR